MTLILARFPKVLLGYFGDNTRPNRIGCITVHAEAFLVVLVRQDDLVFQGRFAGLQGTHLLCTPTIYMVSCKRETERLVVFPARS